MNMLVKLVRVYVKFQTTMILFYLKVFILSLVHEFTLYERACIYRYSIRKGIPSTPVEAFTKTDRPPSPLDVLLYTDIILYWSRLACEVLTVPLVLFLQACEIFWLFERMCLPMSSPAAAGLISMCLILTQHSFD